MRTHLASLIEDYIAALESASNVTSDEEAERLTERVESFEGARAVEDYFDPSRVIILAAMPHEFINDATEIVECSEHDPFLN